MNLNMFLYLPRCCGRCEYVIALSALLLNTTMNPLIFTPWYLSILLLTYSCSIYACVNASHSYCPCVPRPATYTTVRQVPPNHCLPRHNGERWTDRWTLSSSGRTWLQIQVKWQSFKHLIILGWFIIVTPNWVYRHLCGKGFLSPKQEMGKQKVPN